MSELGIGLVRVGEFAWSRIEPQRDQFDWGWLDEALEVLAACELRVILCTPTACPPKWLVDEYPDIMPVDEHGRVRGFGSRRHYRFASARYRCEMKRICEALLERYGQHPAIAGWQLDNEYGCHETTLSYSADDLLAFQRWLQHRYGDVKQLNEAWGAQFWSQSYHSFDSVELPVGTVTEANPAHRMDYWRFASEQVGSFNRDQVSMVREHAAPEHWITHNFMGNFVEFDHFAVGRDIDVASWDSYPLGFLDQGWDSEEDKQRYRRIGHPDWAAFHHDLYRGVGRGRMAVMEQQPGPVNWAPSNAQPQTGAVAYWSMEAIAHGAEFVSYFRFRQYPRAQEQMHAALQLPDGSPAPVQAEIRELAAQLQALPEAPTQQAPVALLFDYASCWGSAIQPHAQRMENLPLNFEYYRALRSLGVNIDVLGPESDFTGYELIVVPSAIFADKELVDRLQQSRATCVFGPRSASRTEHFALPDNLAPGALQSVLPLRVLEVDSMRQGSSRDFVYGEQRYAVQRWFERIDSELPARIITEEGDGLWFSADGFHYLNGWLPHAFLREVFAELLTDRALVVQKLPPGLRLRRRGELLFAFNAGPESETFSHTQPAELLVGSETLTPGGYAVWRLAEPS